MGKIREIEGTERKNYDLKISGVSLFFSFFSIPWCFVQAELGPCVEMEIQIVGKV